MPLTFNIENISTKELANIYCKGLSDDGPNSAYATQLLLYGGNIFRIPEKSVLNLLIEDLLAPF